MSQVIVGLDIGTTKIACFVGTMNEHGKIEILSMGKSDSLGVSRGVVSNIDKTIDSIKTAVEEAQSRVEGDLIIRIVNVGIAGQHIKSYQHRGMLTRTKVDDEISQKDIDNLIEDMYRLAMEPGEEIIHVLPQEYIVDNEQGIKDPIGMSGVRLEANFHTITGHVSAARNINRCVERAGLKVADTILEPLASAEAVLSEDEKDMGIVLVDIGGGTTDIAIFHEGIIRHTAVIPFGGNVITDDIKEGCAIMKKQAEALKVKYGSALASESQDNEVVCIPGLRGRDSKEISLRNLASIIQARMEEIIEHVYYEIRNSGYEKKLHGGIVVTGGGAQLKHITQLFEFITGMDTRIGYPTEHLGSSNSIENLTSPMYSTGIGLVLKGFQALNLNEKRNKIDQVVEETKPVKKGSKVRDISNPEKRGGFFDAIIKRGKEFLAEED
ncbi:MAG: cell division protein FtsA [Crocinitomicaceae bacterium]|nr:cell division protein FtsA [Crocinitomicaceae bacterium]